MSYVTLYLSMLTTFLMMDGIWLGLVAKGFYADKIGHLMSKHPNWMAAAIFYAIYLAAIILLVILPAIDNGSWSDLLIKASVFGLVCYATYDLTNQAVLRNWPMSVTVIDMIWGVIITTSVSVVGFIVARQLGL